jgi:3-methyladenine DNA glycosylase AlkD
MLKQLLIDFKKLSNPTKAEFLAGFFKTGKGQYAEGDIFLGITVPEQRKLARGYADLSLSHLTKLLNSKIHEHRLTALFILVQRFSRTKQDNKTRKELFTFYMDNKHAVNNWDLVDSSSPYIVGTYLKDKNRKILYKLAASSTLWDRRIAIVATLAFIRDSDFADTLQISELLLNDKHDLIHKASGWMLREIGKRDRRILENFLIRHHKNMPRTMLRYAIEHFDKDKKQFFMLRSSLT